MERCGIGSFRRRGTRPCFRAAGRVPARRHGTSSLNRSLCCGCWVVDQLVAAGRVLAWVVLPVPVGLVTHRLNLYLRLSRRGTRPFYRVDGAPPGTLVLCVPP